MSACALTWAFGAKVGEPTAKLMLVRMADQANDLGITICANSDLAEFAETSSRTVQRHLQRLEKAGLIRRWVAFRGGKQKPNIHLLQLEASEAWIAEQDAMLAEVIESAGLYGVSPVTPMTPVSYQDLNLKTLDHDQGQDQDQDQELKTSSTASKLKKRNIIWDVLAENFGPPAPSEATDFGKTVRDIKANLAAEHVLADDENDWPMVRRQIEERIEEMGEFRSHRSLRNRWTELGERAGVNDDPDDGKMPPHWGPPASCQYCREFWADFPKTFNPECGDCAGTGFAGYVL